MSWLGTFVGRWFGSWFGAASAAQPGEIRVIGHAGATGLATARCLAAVRVVGGGTASGSVVAGVRINQLPEELPGASSTAGGHFPSLPRLIEARADGRCGSTGRAAVGVFARFAAHGSCRSSGQVEARIVSRIAAIGRASSGGSANVRTLAAARSTGRTASAGRVAHGVRSPDEAEIFALIIAIDQARRKAA